MILEQNRWYDFGDFKALLDERQRSTESADYFCHTRSKWLREAWIAGEFGEHVCVHHIRLARESDWPNFQVVLEDGSQLNCEAVEADRNRHRGDEYREAKKLGYPIEHVSQEEMRARRQCIPAALSSAIQRKLDSMNPKGIAALVISLNIGGGIWRAEIEPVIAQKTAKALERFNPVWTLWGGRLYRTYPEGRLSIESKRSLRTRHHSHSIIS